LLHAVAAVDVQVAALDPHGEHAPDDK